MGSGKTKGAGCYQKVSWAELKKLISEETKFPVSRVWLKSLTFETPSSPAKTEALIPENKKLPTPIVTHKRRKEGSGSLKNSNSQKKYTNSLFGTGEVNFNQYG